MIRKPLLFALLLSLCLCRIIADDYVAIEPRIGVMGGTVGEYLFMQKSDGHWNKNSYLEWEEVLLPTIGVAATGVFGSISVSAYVDGVVSPRFRGIRSGNMYDSDWKIEGIKTNYSISENVATSNVQTGVVLRYDFALLPFLRVAPFAEISYGYKSFEANNGYGWYGNTVAWDDPSAHYYPDGKSVLCGIDYHCHTLSVYAGLSFRFLCSARVSVQADAAFLPYAYVYAEDCHYTNVARTKGRYYVDIVHAFGTRCKASLSVAFRVSRFWELGITVTGLAGGVERGDTYERDTATNRLYQNKGYQGGFSVYEASARLSAKVFVF
ncbi:MAG: hypothetical protein K2J81_05370 [Treponemataceae bacterium]|nr:hypothetical protein [Treponemataceae bacterium]